LGHSSSPHSLSYGASPSGKRMAVQNEPTALVRKLAGDIEALRATRTFVYSAVHIIARTTSRTHPPPLVNPLWSDEARCRFMMPLPSPSPTACGDPSDGPAGFLKPPP
jgi:hypothetical protein